MMTHGTEQETTNMTEENPHKVILWERIHNGPTDFSLECQAEGCNWQIPTTPEYEDGARMAAREHTDMWNLRQANAGHAALIAKLGEEKKALTDALAAGDASDGYHTHKELYAYRLAFHAHAAMLWHALGYPVVKSWKHHDGEPCFGKSNYFIVVAQLPTGQVSNHYAGKFWDLFRVPFVETAPEWDGHDPKTAEKRIRESIAKVDLDNYLAVTTASKDWIEELKKDSAVLHALYAGGVDNWEGYELSLEEMNEEDEE
jgi:hypothetical protein